MFWSLRENLCGLNHMGRLTARLALGRSRLFYVERLKSSGFAVEPVLDDRGETLNCRLCGYSNLRFALSPGFEMTACSSLALSVLRHKDQLDLWSRALPHNSKEALQKANLTATGAPVAVVKGSAGSESVV